MRKFIGAILAISSAFAMLPMASFTASAAEKKTVFMEEQFEGETLSAAKWTVDAPSETITLHSLEETAHISTSHNPQSINIESYLLGFSEKIQGLEVFQFDYLSSLKTTGQDTWYAMYFTSSNEFELDPNSGIFADGEEFVKYTPEMFLYPNHINCPNASDLEGNNVAGDKYVDEWCTIRLEIIDETHADVYRCLQSEKAGLDEMDPFISIQLKDVKYNFKDLYIFFGSEAGAKGLNVDNIIVESTNVNVNENFTDPSDISPYIKEYACNSAYSYKHVAPNSYLYAEAGKAGDNILYNSPLKKDESIVDGLEMLNASFDVAFSGGSRNSEDTVAFAFGVDESMQYEDGCYVCVMDKKAKEVSLQRFENGQLTALTDTATFSKLGSTAGGRVKIIAAKGGNVSIYGDDQLLLQTTIETDDYYVGHFGFVMLSDNAGNVKIDNMKVMTAKYNIPVTKSVSHNFESDYFGNKDYEDFVMYTHAENVVYVEDGKLVFNGASDETYFGSAHQYDDFVLDFKICSIYASGKDDDKNATANGRWLGIDVGRQFPGEAQYGSNFTMLIYPIVQPKGVAYDDWKTSSLGFYTSPTSTVDQNELVMNRTEYSPIPADLFKAIQYDGVTKNESQVLAEDAVCIRLVAEKGTLRLYLKRAAETEYTLYYKITNVETFGYTALCCTGFTYAKFDDFSMSNISSLYINADHYVPETRVETVTNTIYDKNNVDTNGLKETELNAAGGCGSQMNASYIVLPLALVGVLFANKQRKSREKK